MLLIVVFTLYITAYAGSFEKKSQDFAPVVDKLLEKGADTSFISLLLNHPDIQFDEKYIKINVTGYLKKPDYSSQYNDYSVKKCTEFIRENKFVLNDCSEKYKVPKEVITAVMWVETKHGRITGNHHIASVYLSAAMADQPEYIEMNLENLHEQWDGADDELPALEEKIKSRARRKASWALSQLLALERMRDNTDIDIMELEGSWAGAFGWSQFLPSSYMSWAVDGNRDNTTDLFNVHDAACSIANYLSENGWGKTRKSRRSAVFHYNNSSDYVDAVLTLAARLQDNQDTPPSEKIKLPLKKQLNR